MTAVTVANVKKESMGSLIIVSADLSSVGNTETWKVPHLNSIQGWAPTCTTAAAIGGTISGSTITFATGSSLACKCSVWGK